MRVRIAEAVLAFSKTLAPEPRRAFKAALGGLANGVGDIRALDGALSGYYRLRVGRIRAIFEYGPEGFINVLFAEHRQLVYEVFEARFIKRLMESPRGTRAKTVRKEKRPTKSA